MVLDEDSTGQPFSSDEIEKSSKVGIKGFHWDQNYWRDYNVESLLPFFSVS